MVLAVLLSLSVCVHGERERERAKERTPRLVASDALRTSGRSDALRLLLITHIGIAREKAASGRSTPSKVSCRNIGQVPARCSCWLIAKRRL